MQEYFLFDPFADYLGPPLHGYRLQRGKYVPIRPVRGRLPSRVLGVHLERHGEDLRLFDPSSGQWLPTPEERAAWAESQRDQEKTAREQAEAAMERLRRENEELRRRLQRES